MEVHTHTHTPRKKFTHYLWEFLMLFLAVFCGFLAENFREHLVEHQREKEYIKSMIEDLQTDTTNLSKVSVGFRIKENLLSSVMKDFDEGVHNYSASWVKEFILSYRGGYPDFYYTDRTLQQLKNSGGMRLIRIDTAAEGIIKYDADIKDLDYEETFLSRAQQQYIDKVLKVWSVDKMYKDAGVTSWDDNKNMPVNRNYWITTDAAAFEQLFNKLAEYNEAIIRHRKDYDKMKTEAEQLIRLLKKEYHQE